MVELYHTVKGRAPFFYKLDPIATHDVDLAAEWAAQVIIIKDGKTMAEGGPSLLANEDLVRGAELRFPVVTQIFRQVPEIRVKETPLTVADAVWEIRRLL